MAACIAFWMKTIEEAQEHWGEGWESIEEYGNSAYGHKLHIWDSGERSLRRCNNCGGYILCQWSKYQSYADEDSFYTSYFPVVSPAEADEMNQKFDGFQIESMFHRRFLSVTNGRYHWAGKAGRTAGTKGESDD